MAAGKYETPKKRSPRNKKPLLLLLSIVLLLTFAVGGTVAYLTARSGDVENQMERTYIASHVNVSGDSIDVTNDGNIDAYIRAAVIVNWMDKNGDIYGIAPTSGDYALTINTNDWKWDTTTGCYYYTSSVESKATTNDFITAITVTGTAPQGYELSVEVVAEAIQAEGKTDSGNIPAYQNAWGITLYG